MFTVYVLENTKNKKYIGSTSNLKERLCFHNDITIEKSRFHRTTYKKGPWRTVFSKEFDSRERALRFERYLKTGVGREWLEHARRGG